MAKASYLVAYFLMYDSVTYSRTYVCYYIYVLVRMLNANYRTRVVYSASHASGCKYKDWH